MSTTSSDSFHAQLAAVIEVLANTAVAEICKLVDDGYAVLRLEITQNQREIDGLRRKLLVAKFQTSRRNNHHLDRLSALRRSSSTLQVNRGPSAPSRARCNPATKSSTQGTGGEEEGAGFPVILKVEGAADPLKDIQPPLKHRSETSTSASANAIPRTLSVEPENLHHVDQRFITRQHSNGNVNRDSHHPSFDLHSSFTTSRDDSNLFTGASEWAEAGASIEVWNNTDRLTTGNCSLDPPQNSGPHQEGRTGSNPDGIDGSAGASAEEQGGDVSGDPSNAAPSLGGNLDWEPDVVVVDSVPIKVEADMSSEWSIINRDGIKSSVKERLQKHRREEELEAAHSSLTESPETFDRNTGLKSSLVVNNTSATSYGGLSSFPSSFSAIKTPGEVLHPQANRGGGKPSSSLNEIPTRPREFSRLLLSSVQTTAALLPNMQPAHDAKGQPLCCELCGKTFRKFQNLRLHQRVHTGEKPYGCRHCSKRFSYQHQKKNHERVHTGEKPFRCPICGKCFVDSSNMKRHVSIHT